MMKNTVVPEPGTRVVVCHVPEHDLHAGLYTMHTVESVDAHGQVVLTDGWRTSVASCWPTLLALHAAVRAAEQLRGIDDFLLRCAQ